VVKMYKAPGETSAENNHKMQERRTLNRRTESDRRITVRFGDVLGRRTGVDRRVVSARDSQTPFRKQ